MLGQGYEKLILCARGMFTFSFKQRHYFINDCQLSWQYPSALRCGHHNAEDLFLTARKVASAFLSDSFYALLVVASLL